MVKIQARMAPIFFVLGTPNRTQTLNPNPKPKPQAQTHEPRSPLSLDQRSPPNSKHPNDRTDTHYRGK